MTATRLPSDSPALSPNVAHIRPSATIAVSQHARRLRDAGRQIIDLGAGEPDFPTPSYVIDAAHAALDAGATRYTAVDGIAPLRVAIAARATAACAGNGAVAAEDVVVSTGSKQALFNACFTLFGPGDEVLIPTPAWPSYFEIISLARATPVPVFGDPERGLKVDADALARAATERTRGLILNSPCNPTGAVYSPAELAAILELAESRGWWVVSDEIYRRIAYERPALGALEVAGRADRLVVIDGVAKSLAMTGWRIGWAIAPRRVAQAMTALQSHTTSNAATPSQHAVLAALTAVEQEDAEIARMVAEYRRRRDLALATLDAVPALRRVEPEGAFYIYLDVSAAAPGHDDPGSVFASHLLEHHGVAVVPGVAFLTPRWVRVSYAAQESEVAEGARRMVAAFHELAGMR